MMLSACSAPVQAPETGAMPSESYTYGIYELTFTVERLSGLPFDEWNIIYTYNGEKVSSGYQMQFPLEIISFRTVWVDIIEKDRPDNTFHTSFSVVICNGGSGKTEVNVTDRTGRTDTLQITCNVTRVYPCV